MIIRYADGEWDGEEIRCPTDDESIIIQRHVIRDMRDKPNLTIYDPLLDKRLSIYEFFDMHAMTMMVIQEVENRIKSSTYAST
jgi:hypothetical protein